MPLHALSRHKTYIFKLNYCDTCVCESFSIIVWDVFIGRYELKRIKTVMVRINDCQLARVHHCVNIARTT